MLTDDEGIRSGVVWGLVFMGAALYFWLIYPLVHTIFPIPLIFLALEGGILMLTLASALHMRGYMYLGNKLEMPLLKRSALALCATLILFGLLIMTSVILGGVFGMATPFLNVVIGLIFVAFGVAALAFAVALVMQYKKYGVLALLVALNGLWLLFFWQPWPAILLFIPSTYLLYRSQE